MTAPPPPPPPPPSTTPPSEASMRKPIVLGTFETLEAGTMQVIQMANGTYKTIPAPKGDDPYAYILDQRNRMGTHVPWPMNESGQVQVEPW